MPSPQLVAALEKADADGWVYVANGAPPLGKRVEVMHILNRSYDTTGECDAAGNWHCCNAFILPNGILTFSPTHWRDTDGSPKGGDACGSVRSTTAGAEGIAQDDAA